MATAATATSTVPAPTSASASAPPPHAVPAPAASTSEQRRGLFAVPGPIRQLFKLFPLRVYPAEALPARAPDQIRERPRLYIFCERDKDGVTFSDYNPSCLKWNTFLRIAGVDVELVSSNNHASPSGALPFLLPASSDPRPDVPLTGSKIERYALDHGENVMHDTSSPRFDAYLSLLSQKIRPAWLYQVYVDPRNHHLLSRWYLPSNPILRASTLHTLRGAAISEILKTTRRPLIDEDQLFADARTAFQTLDRLLGQDKFFFGSETPGMFDAEVYAYTQPIINYSLVWGDNDRLLCYVGIGPLFAHRQRMQDWCWRRPGKH
ncbi:hypothetical protein JDV02_006820 [Purpureocillium takamizusanense]|uniref:Mitochondrial outer membrane protein n=1 Tax=Purpureocillium takamizusanense TaxID=2060973 RepID=A0A9Q8QL16_9HYPO|nr:uncharacterized protein JDV02_006820 [Purpureocillium takamizusanense]UNI20761.1 hypothetical protein JDV02_006820 [Purpureocillium takamizusanense]